MTLPEVLLWQALRSRLLDGLRFRRQHPVGPYVLDFFCAETRVAVEVDGSSHDRPDRANSDLYRDAWLSARGITVLRIAAADILAKDGLGDVFLQIAAACAVPRLHPSPAASARIRADQDSNP